MKVLVEIVRVIFMVLSALLAAIASLMFTWMILSSGSFKDVLILMVLTIVMWCTFKLFDDGGKR